MHKLGYRYLPIPIRLKVFFSIENRFKFNFQLKYYINCMNRNHNPSDPNVMQAISSFKYIGLSVTTTDWAYLPYGSSPMSKTDDDIFRLIHLTHTHTIFTIVTHWQVTLNYRVKIIYEFAYIFVPLDYIMVEIYRLLHRFMLSSETKWLRERISQI